MLGDFTGLKGGGARVVDVYWRCGGPGRIWGSRTSSTQRLTVRSTLVKKGKLKPFETCRMMDKCKPMWRMRAKQNKALKLEVEV